MHIIYNNASFEQPNHQYPLVQAKTYNRYNQNGAQPIRRKAMVQAIQNSQEQQTRKNNCPKCSVLIRKGGTLTKGKVNQILNRMWKRIHVPDNQFLFFESNMLLTQTENRQMIIY